MQSTSSNHLEFDSAALYYILDGYNNGTPGNDGKDNASDTQGVEKVTEDRQGNIDPELTREGRGKTP